MGAGQLGYLLKRRITGTPCTYCIDPATNECTVANCNYCYGTGFQCGYYFPIAYSWADFAPESEHVHVDENRGTVVDRRSAARMTNTQLIAENDVWVGRRSDARWIINSVKNVATFRGVPLVAQVEMRQAPVTDQVYQVPIPDQTAEY